MQPWADQDAGSDRGAPSTSRSHQGQRLPAAATTGGSGSLRVLGKWAKSLLKKDRPLGSEPWFNPEEFTTQKREWLEQQSIAAPTSGAPSWPDRLFEHLFVVGLAPDTEITQVAEELCEAERRWRHHHQGHAHHHAEHGHSACAEEETVAAAGAGHARDAHATEPYPAYPPQVLYRFPEPVACTAGDADEPARPLLSDDELCALAFPAGVTPERLRRSPSLGALDEVVLGNSSEHGCSQSYVFMLRVASNFPLYGITWYVREVLHRPPGLARARYSGCNAPFRACVIAAPRAYVLLSHYPFFELHFKVLRFVLDLERLERLLEYDHEKGTSTGMDVDCACAPAAGHLADNGGASASEYLPRTASCTAQTTALGAVHEPQHAGHAQRYCTECCSRVEGVVGHALSAPNAMAPTADGVGVADGGASGLLQSQHEDILVGPERACSSGGDSNGQSPCAGFTYCEACGRPTGFSERPLPAGKSRADWSVDTQAAAGGRSGFDSAAEVGAEQSSRWRALVVERWNAIKSASSSIVHELQHELQELQSQAQLASISGLQASPVPKRLEPDGSDEAEAPARLLFPPRTVNQHHASSCGRGSTASASATGPARVATETSSGNSGSTGGEPGEQRTASSDAMMAAATANAAVTGCEAAAVVRSVPVPPTLMPWLPGDQTSLVQRMWDAFSPKLAEPLHKGHLGGQKSIVHLSSSSSKKWVNALDTGKQLQASQPAAQELQACRLPASCGASMIDPSIAPASLQQPMQAAEAATAEPSSVAAASSSLTCTNEARNIGAMQGTDATGPRSGAHDGGAQSSAHAPCSEHKSSQFGADASSACVAQHMRNSSMAESFHSAVEEDQDSTQMGGGSGPYEEHAANLMSSQAQHAAVKAGLAALRVSRAHDVSTTTSVSPFALESQQLLAQAPEHHAETTAPGIDAAPADAASANGNCHATSVSTLGGVGNHIVQQQPSSNILWPPRQPKDQQPQRVGSSTLAPSIGGSSQHGSLGIVSAYEAIVRRASTPQCIPSRQASLSATQLQAVQPPSQLQQQLQSAVQDELVQRDDAAAAGKVVPGVRVNSVMQGVLHGDGAQVHCTASVRRSMLLEDMSARREGELSAELRSSLCSMLQYDARTVLAAYHACPVPPPGGQVTLDLGEFYQLAFDRAPLDRHYCPLGVPVRYHDALHYAEAEASQQLQLWAIAALCRSLSLDNLLTLLNAVLLEKQVVVFCPHLGTLSAVVLSLLPLLRPFTWQSLLLPVTPCAMFGFLDAPVPFVLGVQYKTPDVVSRCHGLARVNVYKDAVSLGSSVGALPPMPGVRQLGAALAPHHAALRAGGAGSSAAEGRPLYALTLEEEEAAGALCEVMHSYLARLCGDLRLHTIVDVGVAGKRTGVVMKDSLIEAVPSRDRAFMRAFVETQMFAVYSDAIVSACCE